MIIRHQQKFLSSILQNQVLVLLLPPPGCVTLKKLPEVSVQTAGQDGFQGPPSKDCSCKEPTSRTLALSPSDPQWAVSSQNSGGRLKYLQRCPGRRYPGGLDRRGCSKGQLVEPCRGLTWKDKLLSMMNEGGSFKQKRR